MKSATPTAKDETTALLLAEYFVLTPDRLALLQHKEISANTLRNAQRSLKKTTLKPYIHRVSFSPPSQTQGFTTFAYGLSDKGVELFGGKTFDEHSRETVYHEVCITDFHIVLKLHCDKHSIVLEWHQDDLKHGVHPDAYFDLTYPDGHVVHFFLEIERSKAGHMRRVIVDGRAVRKYSIEVKMDAYYDLYDTEDCLKEWGFKKFRVITLLRIIKPETLLPRLEKNRMYWISKMDDHLQFQTPKDSERTYSFLDI